MQKRWWRRELFWAGVLTGLFFAALAVATAIVLGWRDEARLWLGVIGFSAGATFEWLRLGTRRYAALAAIAGFVGIGWYLVPEESRARVDWLAPIRNTAPALEDIGIREIVLPDPPPDTRTRSGGARATGSATARTSRFSIEVHNTEGDAQELTYSVGSRSRPLGRIPGGAIQRFVIEGVAGSTIQLVATGTGTRPDDRLTVSLRLDPGSLLKVTLRRS